MFFSKTEMKLPYSDNRIKPTPVNNFLAFYGLYQNICGFCRHKQHKSLMHDSPAYMAGGINMHH